MREREKPSDAILSRKSNGIKMLVHCKLVKGKLFDE